MTKCLNRCKVCGTKEAVEKFNELLISKKIFDKISIPEGLESSFKLIIDFARQDFSSNMVNHIYTTYANEINFDYYGDVPLPEFWMIVALEFDLQIIYSFASHEEKYIGRYTIEYGEVTSEIYSENPKEKIYSLVMQDLFPQEQTIISFKELKERRR